MSDLIDTVLQEMTTVLARVSRDEVGALADRLNAAQRVFVAGEGRSGFMAKAFAMRLMHLGLPVHVVGETTTPSVADGDVVVGVSGSGTTAGTVRVAEQAVKVGATVHAVTTDPDSPLARHADVVLTVPAATKYRRAGRRRRSSRCRACSTRPRTSCWTSCAWSWRGGAAWTTPRPAPLTPTRSDRRACVRGRRSPAARGDTGRPAACSSG